MPMMPAARHFDSIADIPVDQFVIAGSLIFCHSPDLIGKAIRIGEWIKHGWRQECYWNHVAIAIENSTNPLVAQATVDGCTITAHLRDLKGGPIAIVRPLPYMRTWNIVDFATAQASDGYGYLTLLGIVIDQLLPRWLRFQIGRYGTWICSALGGECWRFGGWLSAWPDIYSVSPAQLAIAVGIDKSLVFKHK